MAYTKHGPFVNGSAPGIDASFLNEIESAFTAMNPAVYRVNTADVQSTWDVDAEGLLSANGFSFVPSPDDGGGNVINSVSGTVSGLFRVLQVFTGNATLIHLHCDQYKSASSQTVKVPYPVLSPTIWRVTELQGGKIEALASGVAQTFSIQTGMALGGGTQAPQTFMNSWSFGMCRSGFDSIRITVTGATATTSMSVVQGAG